jgi:hypothetical protein
VSRGEDRSVLDPRPVAARMGMRSERRHRLGKERGMRVPKPAIQEAT